MIGKITIRNSLRLLSGLGLYQNLPDAHNDILMYHCVGAGGYDNISTSLFRDHLEWLQASYHIVPVSEILSSDSSKKIAITFDDGLSSFYENAFPILQELSVPATLFVIGGTLNGTYTSGPTTFMTPDQVRQVAEHSLVEIGSHTMNHPRLSRIENDAEIHAEISDAAKLLEDLIGQRVDSFCYPYNDWSERVKNIVKHYHSLAVCGDGDSTLLSGDHDPLSLPRTNGAISLFDLKFKVSDFYKKYNINL